MDFWATLLGAAAGVVAGALIQYLVQFFINLRTQRQQRQALKKELQYNLQVVSELADECTKLRNAVNSDTLPMYFGFFGFGQAFFVQTTTLFTNGTLYQWFTIETLKKLQKISAILNINHAGWVNNNVSQRRDAAKAGNFDKAEAVQFVNYLDQQISETRTLLNEMIALI
jgi:hypothetical protein